MKAESLTDADINLRRQLYRYAEDFNQLLDRYDQLSLAHDGLRGTLANLGNERVMLANLIKATQLIYLLTNDTGEILDGNAAARSWQGDADLLGRRIETLFCEASRPVILNLLGQARPANTPHLNQAEARLKAAQKNGAEAPEFIARVFTVETSDPATRNVQWILSDSASHSRHASPPGSAIRLFRNSAEGVIITDKDTRILAVNPSFTRITGYEASEVLGQTPVMLKSGVHDESFYQDFWRHLLNEGYWQGEIYDRRKNGSMYPAWLSVTKNLNDQGKITGYIGMFSDTTDHRHADTKLAYLANHDPLTGMPNRNLLHDRISQQIGLARRDKRTFTIAFIDLDGFKQVNDRHGHQSGDEVLKSVAGQLKKLVRDSDTVARVGGDEFVILAPGLSGERDVSRYARDIIGGLRAAMAESGEGCSIGASIGTAEYPDDGQDEVTLIRLADNAMYQAKAAGGNRHQAHEGRAHSLPLNQGSLSDATMASAFSAGQFFLVYQPLLAFDADCTLTGVEALVRWRHPDLGVLGPDLFIESTERNGLIVKLGAWVLDSACRQLAEWDRRGLSTLRMSVNVSPAQLHHPDFQKHVLDALSAHGLAADRLELELTESEIRLQPGGHLEMLNPLRDRGVKIAIDDFGTGYSNLSRLRLLPVDRLKIDRAFIQDMEHSQDARNLSGSIISMGKSLGLEVVAEGVESATQYAGLKQHGCHYGQGYYMGKPMDPDHLFVWATQHRATRAKPATQNALG